MSDESPILRLVPPPPSPEEAKRAAGIRETLLFAEMVGLKIDEAQAIFSHSAASLRDRPSASNRSDREQLFLPRSGAPPLGAGSTILVSSPMRAFVSLDAQPPRPGLLRRLVRALTGGGQQ
jgi:hypothetical protein